MMKGRTRRFLAMLLSFAMLLSCVGVTAFAEEEELPLEPVEMEIPAEEEPAPAPAEEIPAAGAEETAPEDEEPAAAEEEPAAVEEDLPEVFSGSVTAALRNSGEILEGDDLVWVARIQGNASLVTVRWQVKAEDEATGEAVWETVGTGETFTLTATPENLAKTYRVVLLNAAGAVAASAPVILPEVAEAEALIELEPIEEEIPEEAPVEADPVGEALAAEEEPADEDAADVETADDSGTGMEWDALRERLAGITGSANVTISIDSVSAVPETNAPLVVKSGTSVTLNITGTLDRALTASTSKADGCVIYVESGATLTLRGGGTVTGGGNSGNGGGIYNEGTLVLAGINISNNFSGSRGGGIYNVGTVVVQGNNTIAGNRCTEDGGGLCNYGGTVNMTGGSITGNTAGAQGGGICHVLDGEINLVGGSITENTSTYEGGGIFVRSQISQLNMASSVTICDNKCLRTDSSTKAGSNLYLDDTAVITLIGSFGSSTNVYVDAAAKQTGGPITSGYREKTATMIPSACLHADDTGYTVDLDANGEVQLVNKNYIYDILDTASFNIGEGETEISCCFSQDMKNDNDHLEGFTFTYYAGRLGDAGTSPFFTVGADHGYTAVYEDNGGSFGTNGYSFNLTTYVEPDLPIGEYIGYMNYWATWTDASGNTQSRTGTIRLQLDVVGYEISGTGELSGGTIAVDPATEVKAGTPITLTAYPANNSKALTGIQVKNVQTNTAVSLANPEPFVYTFEMPASNVQVNATFGDSVIYVDAQGEPLVLQEPYTVVSSTEDEWSSGWYVLKNSCSFSPYAIRIDGNVNLILCDGKQLSASNVFVGGNDSLTIWAQSNQTGKLSITTSDQYSGAGIGAQFSSDSAGTLTVNGGEITVSSTNTRSSAIGGYDSYGGHVTINAGKVTATVSGVGHTPGIGGNGGSVTINGGTVTAQGGNTASNGAVLKDIGGGGVTVTITGGTVNATSQGILGSTVTISGGTVNASSTGQYASLDIKATTVDISGGKVNATKHGINATTVNLSYADGATADDITVKAKSISGTVNMADAFMDSANVQFYTAQDYPGSDLGSDVELVPLAFTWATLQSMINAAADGSTIALLDDCTATATDTALTVPAGKTLTLDLNGYVLDRGLDSAAEGGNVITNNGTLTIKSSTDGGVITGGYNTGSGGGIVNNGTLTVESGSISGNGAKEGGGVCNAASATMTVTGGVFGKNTATQYGGGGIVNFGTLTVTGGTITRNSVPMNGAGIWNGGTLNLEGGRIMANQAGSGQNGGGIYFTGDNAVLNIEGSPMITGNTPNNLFFNEGKVATATGAFGSDMVLHLSSKTAPTASTPVTLITGVTGSTSGLHSDNTAYMLVNDGGAVKLCAPVTVTFDPGDENATGDMDAEEVGGGLEYILPDCDYEVTGKAFVGWLVGSDTEPTAAGESVTVTGDTTLTAAWQSLWSALQQQINQAADGDTIVVRETITACEDDIGLVIPSGKTVKLTILSDGTLDRSLSGSEAQTKGYAIAVLGTLYIQGSGVITGASDPHGAVVVDNGGTLYLSGGSITGNECAGLYLLNNSVSVVSGGSITANTGSGLVVDHNATLSISDGSITGNSEYGILAVGEYRYPAPPASVVKLSGNPNVSGNTAGNVALVKADAISYPVIEITGALTGNAPIGITIDPAPTADSPIVFTDGLSGRGTAANFTSDVSGYVVDVNEDGEAMLCVPPVITINGVSGSFNEKIKLNFYFDIPETFLEDEDAYVTLTNEATGYSVNLPIAEAEQVEGKGSKFSIPLAAKEASDTITARVFDGQDNALTILGDSGTDYTESGVQRTLMQYFAWLAEEGPVDERALGAAAKDYCAAAQIYFNYNADGLSVSSAVNAVTAEDLDDYIAGREGTLPKGVSVAGITAMLESDNTIRLYLKFKKVDPGSLTFQIDGESATLHQRSDGMYYLALGTGVWSNHLQDNHDYTVSDGTNEFTITASVLTYARACVVNGNETDINLGKALYLYNQAACDLFGNN